MPRPKHIACQAVCWTAGFPQQDLIGQHMSKTTSWGQHPQFVGWHIFENWKTTFETARQECVIAAGSWFDLLASLQGQLYRKCREFKHSINAKPCQTYTTYQSEVWSAPLQHMNILIVLFCLILFEYVQPAFKVCSNGKSRNPLHEQTCLNKLI